MSNISSEPDTAGMQPPSVLFYRKNRKWRKRRQEGFSVNRLLDTESALSGVSEPSYSSFMYNMMSAGAEQTTS